MKTLLLLSLSLLVFGCSHWSNPRKPAASEAQITSVIYKFPRNYIEVSIGRPVLKAESLKVETAEISEEYIGLTEEELKQLPLTWTPVSTNDFILSVDRTAVRVARRNMSPKKSYLTRVTFAN